MVNPRVIAFIDALSQDVTRSWSVPEMADALGISTAQFTRVFKTLKKMSPAAWHLTLRLDAAHTLLCDPMCDQKMKQIAYAHGFNDERVFSRHFKRRYGVTPTEFQQQVWKTYALESQIAAL